MRLNTEFIFFRPTPPLADLRFSDLVPSHTARMGMASMFADVHGYTAFVDEAVERGSAAIKNAVRAVHVIREELNAVLKTDFGGKRIRFIGDCIHGVIGKGTRAVDDPVDAIAETALCASAMRSSFGLCQELLGGIDSLDLAVGIEFGPVPVTRIGKRGDESVRCAAGRAVVVSEKMQQSIEAGGVRLGPVANQYASQMVRKLYASASRIPSFGAAADLLSSPASPAVHHTQHNFEPCQAQGCAGSLACGGAAVGDRLPARFVGVPMHRKTATAWRNYRACILDASEGRCEWRRVCRRASEQAPPPSILSKSPHEQRRVVLCRLQSG
jgi:hypothetical protein